jgi:hypothetical protein
MSIFKYLDNSLANGIARSKKEVENLEEAQKRLLAENARKKFKFSIFIKGYFTDRPRGKDIKFRNRRCLSLRTAIKRASQKYKKINNCGLPLNAMSPIIIKVFVPNSTYSLTLPPKFWWKIAKKYSE